MDSEYFLSINNTIWDIIIKHISKLNMESSTSFLTKLNDEVGFDVPSMFSEAYAYFSADDIDKNDVVMYVESALKVLSKLVFHDVKGAQAVYTNLSQVTQNGYDVTVIKQIVNDEKSRISELKKKVDETMDAILALDKLMPDIKAKRASFLEVIAPVTLPQHKLRAVNVKWREMFKVLSEFMPDDEETESEDEETPPMKKQKVIDDLLNPYEVDFTQKLLKTYMADKALTISGLVKELCTESKYEALITRKLVNGTLKKYKPITLEAVYSKFNTHKTSRVFYNFAIKLYDEIDYEGIKDIKEAYEKLNI